MSDHSITCDVLVIGGGPAGMMAAIHAALRGRKVCLLEKNRKIGRKLDETGGGRCNIANNEPDTRKLLANYGDAAPFLFAPFSRFGLEDTIKFFESHKLPLVTQARQRMFPESEKAEDVTRCLERAMKKAGVIVQAGETVISCTHRSNMFEVTAKDGHSWRAESLIIATGGISRPKTGSTGDGFKWLQKFGHTIHKPNPSIVPLRTSPEDDWVKELSGTSLSFMRINFYSGGKRVFSKLGKLLFTHFGISGPLILNSAKEVAELLQGGPVSATIDLYPDTEFDALERRVRSAFESNKNKEFKTLLPELVPAGMSNAIISQHVIKDVKTPVHSITKEERRALIHILKALPLTITGLMGMDRAVVSDGGVPLTEIDTRTFESKVIPNLYVIGDSLHVSRPSGGYSLQLCWTSGFVSGNNA